MFLLSTATLFRAYADLFVLVSNILLATDIPTIEERFRAGNIYRYRFYFAYLVIFQVEVSIVPPYQGQGMTYRNLSGTYWRQHRYLADVGTLEGSTWSRTPSRCLVADFFWCGSPFKQ